MKKWLALAACVLILVLVFFWFRQPEQQLTYGVFIGMEKEELFDLEDTYDQLVLDASNLEKSDLEKLEDESQQIFSYLNVGALEKSNSYYQDFNDLTFKPYNNWPDESWLDVTNPEWQEFLVGTLAQNLKDKGVDGLFLDNFDVYDHDKRPEVYDSLIKLLKRFKEMEMPVIINGGSTFVTQVVTENPKLAQQLIYGVNQESVFLAYDFDADKPTKQKKEDKEFYLDYLEPVAKANIEVFLIEYGASSEEMADISKECQRLGYRVYFSPSILLEQE